MAQTTHIGKLTHSGARSFNPVSKAFHWLMAVIILVAWGIGYYGGGMLHYGVSDAETAQKIWAINLHKSIATTTLFLIVARIIWRAYHRPPELTDMPAIMKLATHLGHWSLYLLMIAVPLSGWANSSSAGYKIPVLGLFTIPQLGPKNPALTPYLVEAHFYLSWALLLVVVGHAVFALKHHFIDKDETLTSMLPKQD
ncbi:cytochrome b561 [Azorhizobium oxalatiphilum]|uniref:Cytochrome b561 n=1 Tax=Azorhizobium oxalatiphilum TaxID=980631 RepID=A0A917BZH8_9HYPH|nr:cytochrome b [Azorhizobium oxalatiphilum]GGF65060.1 cytochrome b561 [Azorhizobium oxalatiphilum]